MKELGGMGGGNEGNGFLKKGLGGRILVERFLMIEGEKRGEVM